MVRVMDNPIKAKQDEITTSVRELLMDGAILQEIKIVLREHFAKKNLWILQHQDGTHHVYNQISSEGAVVNEVFVSPSLTACVEFALKWEAPNA